MLRPEAINTRLQAFDAMDIEIKMDVTMCSEIGEQTLPCGGEESRKLREGDRLAPTLEVKSRTPCTNDGTETVVCGDRRRQADFPAPGYLRLAKRGDGGFCAELRGRVNAFDQRVSFVLLRQSVGLATKHNRLVCIQLVHRNGWAVKPDD
jgi:hypothetical protein